MAGRAFTLYLSQEHIDLLLAKARERGVPYSALADVLLGLALNKARPELIDRLLEARLQGSATPKQTRVLGALGSLTQRFAESGVFRFDVGTVADAADLPPREAYRALCALEGRGEVVGVRGEQLDRWGRPAESWWRLAEGKGEGR